MRRQLRALCAGQLEMSTLSLLTSGVGGGARLSVRLRQAGLNKDQP
jgi:hypothetical protein